MQCDVLKAADGGRRPQNAATAHARRLGAGEQQLMGFRIWPGCRPNDVETQRQLEGEGYNRALPRLSPPPTTSSSHRPLIHRPYTLPKPTMDKLQGIADKLTGSSAQDSKVEAGHTVRRGGISPHKTPSEQQC